MWPSRALSHAGRPELYCCWHLRPSNAGRESQPSLAVLPVSWPASASGNRNRTHGGLESLLVLPPSVPLHKYAIHLTTNIFVKPLAVCDATYNWHSIFSTSDRWIWISDACRLTSRPLRRREQSVLHRSRCQPRRRTNDDHVYKYLPRKDPSRHFQASYLGVEVFQPVTVPHMVQGDRLDIAKPWEALIYPTRPSPQIRLS